jgi:hypothetical protein
MALQIRRGTDAERLTTVFAAGEPVYATDTKKFYVGDGLTLGGVTIDAPDFLSDIGDVFIASNVPTTITFVEADGIGNVTITTNTAHGLIVGNYATVAATINTVLDGTWEVTGTPSTTQVIFAGPSVTLPVSADSGTVTKVGANIPDKSVLAWDDINSRWTSAYNVGDFGNIDFTGITLADNYRLAYDSANSKWIALEGSLSSLDDVAITTPAEGDSLVYDQTLSTFVNIPNTVANLGDVSATGLKEGDSLERVNNTWSPRPHIAAKDPLVVYSDLYVSSEPDTPAGRESEVDTSEYGPYSYPDTSVFKFGTGGMNFSLTTGPLIVRNIPKITTQPWTVQFWFLGRDDNFYPPSFGSIDTDFVISSASSAVPDYDPDQTGFRIAIPRRRNTGTEGPQTYYHPTDLSGEPQFFAASPAMTLWQRTNDASGDGYIVGCNQESDARMDGEWHHCCFQREDDYTYSAFLDGKLQMRRTLTELINFSPIDFDEWRIGGFFPYFNAAERDMHFDGAIDDLQFYSNTVLYPNATEFNLPAAPSRGYGREAGGSIDMLYDVNTTYKTTASDGDVLRWDGAMGYWTPSSTAQDNGRGDGGDFDTTTVSVPSVDGIYGGGDFDTATEDTPVANDIFDAGDFD